MGNRLIIKGLNYYYYYYYLLFIFLNYPQFGNIEYMKTKIIPNAFHIITEIIE